MPTAYDYRPGLADFKQTQFDSFNKAEKDLIKNRIFLESKYGDKNTKSKNDFMNLTVEQVYNNIINLLPHLYNNYHKKYLESSLKLKENDEYVSENIIVRETLISFIFSNKNMMYVGIIIIFLSFLLYMINL